MRDVLLQLLTRASFGSPRDGVALMREIASIDPLLAPVRYGSSQPLRTMELDPGVAEHWHDASFLWRSSGSASAGHLIRRVWQYDTHAHLLLEADSTRVSPASLVHVFERSAERWGADYGFVHHFTPPDEVRSGPNDPFEEGEAPDLQPTVDELEVCLPTLFWGNVLGPPYVELFGRQVLSSAPAALVREIAPDTYFIQVTPDIADLVQDYAAFDAARDRLIEHLGRDAFWDPARGYDAAYRAPVLDEHPKGHDVLPPYI